MATPREHIEEIRKKRFWIGVGEKNPLSKTVYMSVKYLSAELYSKDVHFLMELIQNAEDNEYPQGVEPTLEFIITSQDITATGAPATLLIFNNEKGFSPKNMESICNVGDSTKAGKRKQGYIGEKGIGFKSVFLLTATPYIFSNGYQIRFSETPCPECNIAYIVPEWVDCKPSMSDIQEIYGNSRSVPTTTIILPLKSDKVKPVKEQLSNIHPELLLFLSKIKQLSVREINSDSTLNTVRAISISSERDVMAKKNIDAESYTVDLSSKEEGDDEDRCWYYMWRQKFPVKKEHMVEKRMDIEEFTITLAFPYAKRLTRGMSQPGIYAFLPTETVTDLPFVIQADFLLPSSRETILWDNVWNQGILDCVPTAFINAFVTLVRTSEDAPVSSLASMFNFLPIKASSHPKLNTIRESIKEKLLQENIIPSESSSNQKFFHKPGEVWRLMTSFWNILVKAKDGGTKLHNLSNEGKHILNSTFDVAQYDDVLQFLGIKYVENGWYPKCIQRCNLVLGVGEDVYRDLLHFVAENWESNFNGTSLEHVPLLKYVDASGNISLLSISEARRNSVLYRSYDSKYTSWLIDWALEFRCEGRIFLLPKRMQELCSEVIALDLWLRDSVNVQAFTVYEYACQLLKSLGSNRSLVLAFSHFLYHSYSKGFVSQSEVECLCSRMPLLNAHGGVSTSRAGVLVPANRSKWIELIGSNPWGNEKYVELSQEYLHSGLYASQFTPQSVLISFLERFTGASDIPKILPPDACFPTVYGPMTKKNAFYLLDWIRSLRSKRIAIPSNFISCIKKGSWLKVTMSGCSGYKPPCESFLPGSSWGSLLQSGSDMVDIPLIDVTFYGYEIQNYADELKAIGVMTEIGEACEFIGRHLMSLANNYNLTRTKVLAMLNFVRFLRGKYLPVDEFINCIKVVDWVKTSCGEMKPDEAVLYDLSWEPAKAISNIPFIDLDYYGRDILDYKSELGLLGVTVGFEDNYQIVIDNLKSSSSLNCMQAKHLIFSLKCVRHSFRSNKIISSLEGARCLRTSTGYYLNPSDCFLFDHEWGSILKIFEGFPCVESDFYGQEIFNYKDELRRIGVTVDFDAASKAFFTKFKQQASTNCTTFEQVLSFLACYRKLGEKLRALSDDFREIIHKTKWLKTRLGSFTSPDNCILFNSGWDPISQITLLPFIDDTDNGYGRSIHNYEDELKNMGVVVDLEKGSHFVLSNINFPQNSTNIPPSSVISLLQCIKNSKSGGLNSLPDSFLGKIQKTKWLKTTVGYMYPQESLLFDVKQKSSLCKEDGPFIDEDYYGVAIYYYREQLAAIGVTVDLSSSDASSLIAQHIKSHSDFPKIERIYNFLSESHWKPGEEGARGMIWIPDRSDEGIWVSPQECVLYDDNGLFRSRFHVLDQKKYKPKTLIFFSAAFGVKSRPSTDDYLTLWKEWEDSRDVISQEECCSFLGHVIKHMTQKTEKMITESVRRIPSVDRSSGAIHLRHKQDVFIPDDLLLKDLFENSCHRALFVWYPTRNLPGLKRDKLYNIYAKIGVQTISGSVTISELSTIEYEELNRLTPADSPLSKGLVMIILGFLADPLMNFDVKQRHEAVNKLMKLDVFETTKPMMMSYNLEVSSGDSDIQVNATRMVHWAKESSKFYTQKLDMSVGCKNTVEYATNFAQVLAEGLLWENEDQIPRLSELIKFGFLMNFNEAAVIYFMKSKKLELFEEDEEFLSSAFPSC